MGDLKVNPYGSNTSVYEENDAADTQTTSSPTDSTSELDDASQGSQTTATADLPKTPLSDPVVVNAFKEKLANMDGTDRQCPAVNVCVNFQGSPEFEALPEAVRNKLLQQAAKDPSVEMRLNQLYDQPLYKGMTTQQRTELLNVFAGANDQGRQELVTLMGRKLPSGQSALLSPDLSTGASLLDNLNKLADQPLSPAAAGRRSEILSQAISDTAEPTWFLDQGQVGTCAPTTLQTSLIINSPSEYVKLLGGLLGPNRQAALANGDTMIPALNDLATPPTVAPGGGASVPDTRSITERVFQSALAQYSYIKGGKPMPIVNASGDIPGLKPKEVAIAQSGLYGRNYRTADDNTFMGTPGLYAQVQSELNKGHGPVPVSLHWGNGGHEVLVDKIEQDAKGNVKVYIRNPWGSKDARGQGYKDGQVLGSAANNSNAGPLRTVADSQSGLEVMSGADFLKAVYGAVVEK